jgi:hypothetical protein
MDKYSIKLEILAEVDAFSEADAREYISDIFNIDDEIKGVKVIKVTKNS